jgi:hypothetical protein
MCYGKQWRLTRRKIGHLLALGVGKRTAILTGVSSKSMREIVCAMFMNRPVRTRMPGGVGRAG